MTACQVCHGRRTIDAGDHDLPCPACTIDPDTVKVCTDDDGKPAVFVKSRLTAPGAWWLVTAEIVTSKAGAAHLATHCPCPSSLRFCWHLRQTLTLLERDGVVEKVGSGWEAPLPDSDGDEAVVVELLAGRKRHAAGVR